MVRFNIKVVKHLRFIAIILYKKKTLFHVFNFVPNIITLKSLKCICNIENCVNFGMFANIKMYKYINIAIFTRELKNNEKIKIFCVFFYSN